MRETDYKTANLGSIHSGSTPEWGRYPEEGNGNPFQYSCLGNFMDRGAWQVHGVTRVGHSLVTTHTTTTTKPMKHF